MIEILLLQLMGICSLIIGVCAAGYIIESGGYDGFIRKLRVYRYRRSRNHRIRRRMEGSK